MRSAWALFLLACGSAEPARSPPPSCPGPWEAVTVAVGASGTSVDGVEVRYLGASHDLYDDGRTDLVLSLELRAGSAVGRWLPSAFDDVAAPVREVGRCARLREGTESLVTVELGPLR